MTQFERFKGSSNTELIQNLKGKFSLFNSIFKSKYWTVKI